MVNTLANFTNKEINFIGDGKVTPNPKEIKSADVDAIIIPKTGRKTHVNLDGNRFTISENYRPGSRGDEQIAVKIPDTFTATVREKDGELYIEVLRSGGVGGLLTTIFDKHSTLTRTSEFWDIQKKASPLNYINL
ncbi:MAG: hypothetical protein ACKO34_04315 [Vampirovibrionales bacterium]